jgi:hypothetical protein
VASRVCIVLLLAVTLLLSGCNATSKQRSYSAFIACIRTAGFRFLEEDTSPRNRRLFPSWLEDVANLMSPHGNYVIVMFVTAEEARARAMQRVQRAITTLGPPPRGGSGVQSEGRRVWFWTSGPAAGESKALMKCLRSSS